MKNEQIAPSNSPSPASITPARPPKREQSIFDLLVPIIVSRRKAGDAYDAIRADLEAIGTPLDDGRWRQLVFCAALELAVEEANQKFPPKPRTPPEDDDHPGRSVICRVMAKAFASRSEEKKNTVIDIRRVDGVWRTNV